MGTDPAKAVRLCITGNACCWESPCRTNIFSLLVFDCFSYYDPDIRLARKSSEIVTDQDLFILNLLGHNIYPVGASQGYCPISGQKCHNNDLDQVGSLRSLASPLMGQLPYLITAEILISFLSTDCKWSRRKRVVARIFPIIYKINNHVSLDLSWLLAVVE